MDIKILGTGCPNCKTLEKNTLEAIQRLGLDASVEKVEDIMDIMSYGIARTPALVLDGKVIMSGRVVSSSEIEKLLTK